MAKEITKKKPTIIGYIPKEEVIEEVTDEVEEVEEIETVEEPKKSTAKKGK